MMYAKTKQTNMSRIEEELEKTINSLQKEIDRSSRDDPGKQEMHRELEKKQRELEQIIEHKTKGAILRSKCRWYNEGEKNTKYFLRTFAPKNFPHTDFFKTLTDGRKL